MMCYSLLWRCYPLPLCNTGNKAAVPAGDKVEIRKKPSLYVGSLETLEGLAPEQVEHDINKLHALLQEPWLEYERQDNLTEWLETTNQTRVLLNLPQARSNQAIGYRDTTQEEMGLGDLLLYVFIRQYAQKARFYKQLSNQHQNSRYQKFHLIPAISHKALRNRLIGEVNREHDHSDVMIDGSRWVCTPSERDDFLEDLAASNRGVGRLSVARAVVTMDSPERRSALIVRLINDASPEVQVQAIEHSRFIQNPGQQGSSLVKAAQQCKPEVQMAVIKQLEYLPDDSHRGEAFLSLAESPCAKVREKLAEKVGLLPEAIWLDYYAQISKEEDVDVLITLGKHVNQVPWEDIRTQIIQFLSLHSNLDVRNSVLRHLDTVDPSDVSNAWENAITASPWPRYLAIEAVKRLPSGPWKDTLMKQLNIKNAWERLKDLVD